MDKISNKLVSHKWFSKLARFNQLVITTHKIKIIMLHYMIRSPNLLTYQVPKSIRHIIEQLGSSLRNSMHSPIVVNYVKLDFNNISDVNVIKVNVKLSHLNYLNKTCYPSSL